MNKMNFGFKTKLAAIGGFSIFTIALIYQGVKVVNDYFDTHYLQFNKVLKVEVNAPIEVKERVPEVKVEKVVFDYPEEIDTPIEQYICDKFGTYDCKTALAVAKAESGLREDAVGINTNNTIDVGIFQINTVHFKKEGCALKDLVVAEKNVDCAYQIWQDQGWTPWVAYTQGRYLVKLDE